MMEACTDSESFSEDLYLDLDDDEDCVEEHKENSVNEMDSAISKLQDSGCVADGTMNDVQMDLFDELLVAENKKRLEKEKQGKQQSKNLLKENEELRSENSALKKKDKMLEEENEQIKEENEQLKKELENTKNMKDSFIGELLDEIKTRDCLIIDLRAEIDRLVFRRNSDHRDNSYSNRHAKYRSDDRSSEGGSRGKKDKGHKRKSSHAEEDSDDISRSSRTLNNKDSKKCKSTVSTKKPSVPLPDLVSKNDCPITSNKDVAEPDELDVCLARVDDHQQSSIHVNSEQKVKNKVSSSGSVTVCDENLETTPCPTRSANEGEHSSTLASSEVSDSACQSIAPAIDSAPTVSEESAVMEQNLVDDDSDPPPSQEKQHDSENGVKPPESRFQSTENSEVMVNSSEHSSTSEIPNELQRALKEFEERQALAFNLLKSAFSEYEVKQGHSTGNLKRAVNDFYSTASSTQTLQTQNQSKCISRSVHTKQAADTLAVASEQCDEHQLKDANISVGQCSSTPVETFTSDSSSKYCERQKKPQNHKDEKSTHDLDPDKQKEKDSRHKDQHLANLAKTVVIATLGASKSGETKHSERPFNYSRNASPLENLYKDSHESRDQTYARKHVSDSWKQASAADPRLYRNRSYSGRFQPNSDFDSTQKYTDHHDKSHHNTSSAEKSEMKGRSERSPTRSKEQNSTDESSHKSDKIVPDIKVQGSSTSKNVTEKNINLFKITGETKNLYQKRLIDKLNRELIESHWSSGEVASTPKTPSPEVEKSSRESRHKTSIKKTCVRKNPNVYSPVKYSLSNRSEHYLRKRKFHKITQSPSTTTDRIPTPLKNDAIKLFHYQNLPVPFAVKRNLGMLKKKDNSESPGASSSELVASTDEQITKTSQNQDNDGKTRSDKRAMSSSQNSNSSTARNDADSQNSDHSGRSISSLSKNNNALQDENETGGNSSKITDNSDMLDASD